VTSFQPVICSGDQIPVKEKEREKRRLRQHRVELGSNFLSLVFDFLVQERKQRRREETNQEHQGILQPRER